MEWLRNIVSYSPVEREVLDEDSGFSLFERYHRILTINGEKIYTVVAPSANSRKMPRLPPIVMLHGLAGSMKFYTYLTDMLNRISDVVLVDLPGHGKSPDPKDSSSFDPDHIVELLNQVIEATCDPDLPFILIGHSYGTTHSLRIASGRLGARCCGVICVAPPYGQMIPQSSRNFAKHMPAFAFDALFLAKDRRGGLYSRSVNLMVAREADETVRKEQLRAVLDARANTMLEMISRSRFYDVKTDKIPECPVLIIKASRDKICPPSKADRMYHGMLQAGKSNVELVEITNAGHGVLLERPEIINGIISNFISDKIDKRLSMAWQLSYLASLDNKWSLKNEEKWRKTVPVGDLVGKFLFKGMKIPREGDDVHSPAALERLHPEIAAVIDISREAPPYDPGTFQRIKYYKFPTVSKIPPSRNDVKGFIKLVEKVRNDIEPGGVIGVHCHYGFNRTGFFICSFLIEKEGFSVDEALQAYMHSRPPGIMHQHFINELHLRYNYSA